MADTELTVVSITWNNLTGLQKTLSSIDKQTVPPKEVIVIDGASTDGTPTWLKTFADQPHRFKFIFISEKDRGIADAFNKGALKASSAWIQFLNSGDTYIDECAIERIKPQLTSSSARILCGGIQQVLGGQRTSVFSEKRRTTVDQSIRLCHPATFCQTALFDDVGLFNLSFKVAMDTEWFLRAERMLGSNIFEMVKIIVTDMEPGGVSQSLVARRNRELLAARLLHSKQPGIKILLKYLAQVLYTTVLRFRH